MKMSLYGKTQRIGTSNANEVTEKLDGSNIGFFLLEGVRYVAQRNNVFTFEEVLEGKSTYKNLKEFLETYGDSIKLVEGSGVWGEWLGERSNYKPRLDKNCYLFCKARPSFEHGGTLMNKVYDQSLIHYAFEDQVVPECFGLVPIVATNVDVSIRGLDELYKKYCVEIGATKEIVNKKFFGLRGSVVLTTEGDVEAPEGFIVNANGGVTKYVRNKAGKKTKHHPGSPSGKHDNPDKYFYILNKVADNNIYLTFNDKNGDEFGMHLVEENGKDIIEVINGMKVERFVYEVDEDGVWNQTLRDKYINSGDYSNFKHNKI